jgi:hypothetical protein
MSEIQLTLTVQEREVLAELLQAELKEARVAEHRTRAPSFRERVLQREAVIEELLRKLAEPSTAADRSGRPA